MFRAVHCCVPGCIMLKLLIQEGLAGRYASKESPVAIFDTLWEDAVGSLGLGPRDACAAEID